MTKVLIVEDERYSRESMIKQVKKFDVENQFEIFEASDGRQGLEIFEKEKPKYVFSDIRMPIMDGLEMMSMILKQDPDVKVIMVSAYADFSYACDAINMGAEGYLLKPVNDSELHNLLQKFIKHSDDNKRKDTVNEKDILTEYIYKKIMTEERNHDYSSDELFHQLYKEYVFVSLYFTDGIHPKKESFLQEMMKNYDKHNWSEFRILYISKKHWGLVLNVNVSKRLLRSIGLYLNKDFTYYIGISNVHQSFSTIKMAFQQSLTAIKYKIFYSSKLLEYAYISANRNMNDLLQEQEIEKISLYIELASDSKAMEIVDSILERMFGNLNLIIDSLEMFLLRLSSILNLIMENYFNENSNFSPINFSLIEFDIKEELQRAIQDSITFICDLVKDRNKSNKERIVESLLNYIDSNYDKEISLKNLAENVFFVNHTYLSSIFSEITGNSYSSYLKKVRMKRAKEYLSEDTFSISEVASYTGYNDSSQFIRIFKQEVGMTPKRYQKLYAKNSNSYIEDESRISGDGYKQN